MSRRKQARPARLPNDDLPGEAPEEPTTLLPASAGESSGSGSEEDVAKGGDAEMASYAHLRRDEGIDDDAVGEEPMPSDPEDMVVSGDEDMDEPEPEGDLSESGGKRLEQVRRHRQDAENNNSLEDGEPGAPLAPPLAFSFPAASHVTLEALQNTKVAVAQFAATTMANNADNEAALQELAVLQSTLFTLQHQQVFQLQLIQQLQNQLSLRPGEGPIALPTADLRLTVPMPARISVPGPPTPSPPRAQLPAAEPTPVRFERSPTPTTTPIPASAAVPATPPIVKHELISIPKPPTPPTPTPPAPTQSVISAHPPYSSISSALASTIITNNDPPPSLNEPNTLEMLQRRAQEVLDSASQGLLANNLADELAFRKSGKMSPYDGKAGGRNEPFFKHRCRYCGKVFGSDSALQIHIRSHTGERPFKCNVCGSRFTTKGNLKVHFQRHTAKFPHVKMNPNPIPEHLDKYHPPLLAQLSPGPIPGMPPHPLSFSPGGPPFPAALPLYRPPHLPQRPLSDKPAPLHPLFGPRDEQELPADLSKPPQRLLRSPHRTPQPHPPHQTHQTRSPPPRTPSEERFKKEPSFEEECDRVTPKREPDADRDSPDVDRDPIERYPTPSPYDDCSMDSKYSSEGTQGRDSPGGDKSLLRDPDQPENLSMRGNTTCNICYKTFACHSALEIHYRSHTKERPFKCTVCDRGFSTKSSGGGCLCQGRSSAPRRPLKPQSATALNHWSPFSPPGNMKQHMLTHKIRDASSESADGEAAEQPPKRAPPCPDPDPPLPKRPSNGPPMGAPPPLAAGPPGAPPLSTKHLCGVCRKNFSSSSALQIHMRTHTGDKPFRCSVCQKAFTTKGNLKVHMGTHMWSNGASRRGRRMSLELPPRPLPLSPQDSDFLQRRPDLFYPYLPAPFLNGMQQKLNEISVIQQGGGQNGLASPGGKFPGLLGFGPFPPPPPPPLSQPASPLSDRQAASVGSPASDREADERRRDFSDREVAMMEERRREMVEMELAERGRAGASEGLPRMWELHYERKNNGESGERMSGSPGGPLPLLGAPARGEGLAA